MKKIKKINGYLVVRFNDRERRDWPELGTFGIIDAELYTGRLEVDRDAFEYDDADTLEVAIEQARGLPSELDPLNEPGVIVTVRKETNSGDTEETVDPAALFRQEKAGLERKIGMKSYPDLDPRAAAYQLYGYARALTDLEMISDADEDFHVDLKAFGAACAFQAEEGTRVDVALPYKGVMAPLSPHDYEEGEVYENCTVQELKCRRCGAVSFAWYQGTPGGADEAQERDTFEHLPEQLAKSKLGRKVYGLGVLLREDCPKNDCKVYSNTFEMALELDKAIGGLGKYPARVLKHELLQRFKELQEMYINNYAVKKFMEGLQS